MAVESDELLLRLLAGNIEGPWESSAARRTGLDVDAPHVAVAVRLTAGTSAAVVSDHLSGVLLERPSLMGWDKGQVLALVSARGVLREPGERRFRLQRMHQLLQLATGRVALGWSCVHAGVHGWRRALDEARQGLSMVVRMLGPGNAGGYAEVSVLSLVTGAHDSDQLRTLQESLLGPLFRHDHTDRADLVATLETYLDSACNASRTAEILRVHRNSVANRLQHIKELADVDLEDPDMRLLVQLILRSARCFSDQPRPGVSAFAPGPRLSATAADNLAGSSAVQR